MHDDRPPQTDHWEIQATLDWVDYAFGGIEAELAAWRPIGWLVERFGVPGALRQGASAMWGFRPAMRWRT